MTRIVATLETIASAACALVVVVLLVATHHMAPAAPDHWRL